VRVLQTSVHDLEEVFALRLLLEVPATRRATELLDEAGRRELRKVFRQMQRAAEADDEFRLWQHDRRFHRALLAASGNTRLASYVDGLRDTVLRQGVSTAGSSRSLSDILAEHEVILERVEAGDADGAAAAMRRHVLHTAELLIAQEGGGVDVALDWTGPG
jgi:DNA-binding GntR family transcriptional regulator